MDVYEATWIPAGWTIRFGDANWDGVFDQLDLVQVLQNSEYLTGGSASWEQGDWNADGEFDRADLVLADSGRRLRSRTACCTGGSAGAIGRGFDLGWLA